MFPLLWQSNVEQFHDAIIISWRSESVWVVFNWLKLKSNYNCNLQSAVYAYQIQNHIKTRCFRERILFESERISRILLNNGILKIQIELTMSNHKMILHFYLLILLSGSWNCIWICHEPFSNSNHSIFKSNDIFNPINMYSSIANRINLILFYVINEQ